jgi:hypothetical protein
MYIIAKGEMAAHQASGDAPQPKGIDNPKARTLSSRISFEAGKPELRLSSEQSL